MGMIFNSQAVIYLGARLSAEFAASASDPAKGLAYWQGSSDEAKEFRDVLAGTTQKKAPSLGSVTLEYFDMTIPDSVDGNVPSGPDPSSGKSYKRWIIFWKQFRKNNPAKYRKLVSAVLDVLNGAVSGITSITFCAHESSSADVVVTDSGTDRKIDLITPSWEKNPSFSKASKKKKM